MHALDRNAQCNNGTMTVGMWLWSIEKGVETGTRQWECGYAASGRLERDIGKNGCGYGAMGGVQRRKQGSEIVVM